MDTAKGRLNFAHISSISGTQVNHVSSLKSNITGVRLTSDIFTESSTKVLVTDAFKAIWFTRTTNTLQSIFTRVVLQTQTL